MNKQSSERFNELIEYIEEHLCEEISYEKLSQILGVNEYTMHRIFLFVTNYNLAEYIRKRRLSMAALDLLKKEDKIIDIAIKYCYESSQAFSRAFKAMMGFLPSKIDNNKTNIKFFSPYELVDEEVEDEFYYHIEKGIKLKLYSISMETSVIDCCKEAPMFWKENIHLLKGKSQYGLFQYNKATMTGKGTYHIASEEKFDNATVFDIKLDNCLVFEFIYSDAITLNKIIRKIYRTIIIDAGYDLTDLPDIEEYLPDNNFRLYIPIK